MRTVATLLVAAAALLAAWLLWREDPLAHVPPSQPGAAAGDARAAPATAPLPAATTSPAVTRDEVVQEREFVSESEQDGVINDAVRDGVSILVLGEDRQPRRGAPIRVRWRKGWGMYGNDRGVTDARGRFATTVAEHEMLEGVVVTEGVHGELGSWVDFLPMANDPRTVLCILPQLHALTVRVVDERGAAIAAATVAFECDRADAVQREFVLVPDAQAVGADREGRAVLQLPAGTHEVTAKADGHDPLYSLRAAVPRGGRAVTMHLLSAANRHDVAVTVVVPPDLTGPLTVGGFTSTVPALPGLEPEGVEPVHLQLTGRATGPRTFVVAAPPMPWRCTARVDSTWGFTDVAAFATAVTVEMVAPPAVPMAKVRCKLLLPDGEATSGEVVVHTKPDLWNDSRSSVDPKAPFVYAKPGGRACVSAWRDPYPPAVVGPIELTAGEQEVVLQFGEARSIRGRVVDEHGNPAKADVRLLRPAGALRSLGNDVPEILPYSASGDSSGTHDDGVFWFDHVGDGEHALFVVPDTTGWPAYVRVQPGDQDVVVRLGDGIADRVRIQGRVTLAPGGTPVAAEVTWHAARPQASTYTDADGRYAVTMPPGVLHVTVRARRCAWFESEPEPLAVGLHTRDLVMTASEPLFVQVRDEAGRVPDVEILAFDEKGRELPFLDRNGNSDGTIAELDTNGRAKLGGLPHAPVRLRLQTEDEKQAMEIDVPAAFARDVDFPIVWKPKPAPKPQPK